MMQKAKPFVKWAGGKSQLLEEIRKRYPPCIEKYCEPFVGGGAILFDVLGRCFPKKVLINDINSDLINVYLQVKNNCSLLVEYLSSLQDVYQNLSSKEERKKLFYQKRQRYNEIGIVRGEVARELHLEKATLFIFLNKTCFNGLYRVNSKGFFNVPYNNAENPLLCDKENLLACSHLLQNVEITAGDYHACEYFIDADTFVYLDPPYRPITKTSNFTAYSSDGFDDEAQRDLSNFVKTIASKGATVLVSNSDPKNTDADDEFFDLLYSDFAIDRVRASRMINRDANGRSAISELLIGN